MEVVHNEEMTQLLIKAGADINAKDVNGWTVLHYAAKNRSSGTVIDILFRAGAKLTEDTIGNMPLHLALRPETVEALIGIGSDVNAENNFGLTVRDQVGKPKEKFEFIAKEMTGTESKSMESKSMLEFLKKEFPIIYGRLKKVSDITGKELTGEFVETEHSKIYSILKKAGAKKGSRQTKSLYEANFWSSCISLQTLNTILASTIAFTNSIPYMIAHAALAATIEFVSKIHKGKSTIEAAASSTCEFIDIIGQNKSAAFGNILGITAASTLALPTVASVALPIVLGITSAHAFNAITKPIIGKYTDMIFNITKNQLGYRSVCIA
jgi:hypothetical protein